MTTYRILLLLTAMCSALITASIINPDMPRRQAEPVDLQLPPAFLLQDIMPAHEPVENIDPLTLALSICTPTGCQYVTLKPARSDNQLTARDGSAASADAQQQVVPFQFPQHGLPVIEM